jgi:hypothetical protein
MKNNLSDKNKSVEKLLLDFFESNFSIKLQHKNISSIHIYACDSFFVSFGEYDDFDNLASFKVNFTFTNCNILNSLNPVKTFGRNDIQFGSSTLKNLSQNISPNTLLNINTSFVDLQRLLKSPSTYKVLFSTFIENKSMFYYVLELHTYLLSSQYASLLELKDLITLTARSDSSNKLILEEQQNEITFSTQSTRVVNRSNPGYPFDSSLLDL